MPQLPSASLLALGLGLALMGSAHADDAKASTQSAAKTVVATATTTATCTSCQMVQSGGVWRPVYLPPGCAPQNPNSCVIGK